MLAKVLFLCAIAGSFSQQIDESMLLNLNTGNQIIQKFISDDVKSWLSPNDGNIATENTPIYAIKQKPKTSKNEAAEYKIYQYKNGMKNVIKFLHQNHSFAITPPSSQQSNAAEETTTTTESPTSSTTQQSEPQKDMNTQIADMLKQKFPNSKMIFPMFPTTTPKPSLPYPTVVYPEIFVIIDNSLFKTLGSNPLRAIIHTLGFFNGVDLLYRNLESPKFRFNIAAILIVEDRNGFPTLEYAPNKIDANELKLSIGEWLYNHQNKFPLNSYDIAVTMTSNELLARIDHQEILLGGGSYPAGACKVFHDNQLVVKTASVTEKGDFHGILAAAHELGHSFGVLKHDDSAENGCPLGEGTMMSPSLIGIGSNAFKWSQCSLEEMTQTFINNEALCLYNKPKGGEPVPRLLPGKLVDTNRQCHFKNENTFAIIEEDICKKLVCRNESDSFGTYEQIDYQEGAIYGSSCGQDKICLMGNCVDLN